MSHDLNGRKQTIVLLSLVIAIVIAILWMRSFDSTDSIAIRTNGFTTYSLESSQEGISFNKAFDLDPPFDLIWWGSYDRIPSNVPILSPIEGQYDPTIWSIPHWAVVMPLTLLSVCSLLINLRRVAGAHIGVREI